MTNTSWLKKTSCCRAPELLTFTSTSTSSLHPAAQALSLNESNYSRGSCQHLGRPTFPSAISFSSICQRPVNPPLRSPRRDKNASARTGWRMRRENQDNGKRKMKYSHCQHNRNRRLKQRRRETKRTRREGGSVEGKESVGVGEEEGTLSQEICLFIWLISWLFSARYTEPQVKCGYLKTQHVTLLD